METITSRSNPKIKQIRSLRQRKGRQATGFFLVEGIRHVGEAAAAGAVVDTASKDGAHPWLVAIYYAPELLTSDFAFRLIGEQSAAGVPCYTVSADVFASITDKENPQGILAIAQQHTTPISDLTPELFPWTVALVDAQDPGNIGTVLRTIDAVGAGALILLEHSADPFQPTAVRASMGTIFWHPLAQTGFDVFVEWANRQGYTIYGTSAHGSVDYRAVECYHRPAVLLMGSEREGLTPEQAAACHQLIRLPMRGHASSLNLAVSTGVFLYEMLRSECEGSTS